MQNIQNTHQYTHAVFVGAGDVDNLKVGGLYAAEGSATAPSTAAWWIEVLAPAQDHIVMQIATLKSAGSRQFRLWDGSVWGEWAAVTNGTIASSSVTYDHTVSGLTATNVKAALDELKALVDTKADA